jgi:3-oxoacyl-[acyl-carrier protein] reductase
MDLGLKGKTALVTGASEGIGAGIAQRLAGEGVRVAICARSEDKLRKKAAEITQATGVEVVPIVTDLGSRAGCDGAVAQAAERLGGIDILVNNAGASAFGPFVDLPDQAFVDAINGKLLAYIRCIKAAVPHMQKRGRGAILNITGTTQQAYRLHTAGSICNAPLRMLSKSLSIELAPLKIRVNSIAPAPIWTERTERMQQAKSKATGKPLEQIVKELTASVPLGRLGHPDDIAYAACFLCSDRAGFISGAAVAIDGASTPVW